MPSQVPPLALDHREHAEAVAWHRRARSGRRSRLRASASVFTPRSPICARKSASVSSAWMSGGVARLDMAQDQPVGFGDDHGIVLSRSLRRAIASQRVFPASPRTPIWTPMSRARVIVMNAALGPLDYRVPQGMAGRARLDRRRAARAAPAARRGVGGGPAEDRACRRQPAAQPAGRGRRAADPGPLAPAGRVDRRLLPRARSPRCCG